MDQIKHITFERSGGFANIRFAADFELDELPNDQADQLRTLFKDLNLDQLTEKPTNPNLADGFSYVLTVESGQGKHTLNTGDVSAPEALQPIFELLTNIARQRMRK